MSGARELVTARVGDLDTEGVPDDVQQHPEVPAGDAAVGDGVGGQLGDDVLRREQWKSPGAQLFGGEQAGEAGAAWRGRQLKAEVPEGGREVDSRGTHSLIHVTQRGGTCFRR